MFDQTLAAPEFEIAVIRACFADRAARDRTHFLSAGDFADPDLQNVWSAMQRLHARGEEVDPLTVGEQMMRWGSLDRIGGMARLTDLAQPNGAKPDAARTYALRVRRAAIARQIVNIGGQLGELGNRALEMDEDEIRAEYNKVTQEGLPAPITAPALTALEGVDQLFERMQNPLNVTPMRIKAVNLAAAGGLAAMMYPGLVSTVIGASGDGKTAWLSQVAEGAAQDGAAVVIIDGEISSDLATARRLQRYSGVPADKQIEQMYDAEPVVTEEQWARLHKAREHIRQWATNIRYLYTPGHSIWAVIDQLYELQREKPINLVILDYIQLFISDDTNRNEAQAISWSVQMFKNFCGQVGAHGYMGSQFSNEAVKSAQVRTQYGAKGSGDIGAKSNMVLTIQRPSNNENVPLKRTAPGGRDVWVQPGEPDIMAKFRVDKNSFGRSGVVCSMIFDGEYYRWVDGDTRHDNANLPR